MTRNLTPRELIGLKKLGDCIIPGDGELKSFSKSECADQVDRILDHMPMPDRNDLKMLLGLLALLPKFGVYLFVQLLELSPAIPSIFGGAILRFIRLGIRGLVMSLYYSNPETLKTLGYSVNVYTSDISRSKPTQSRPTPTV